MDFGNPSRLKYVPQGDFLENQLVLGYPIQSPFSQSDWPNPVRATKVQQPAAQINLNLSTLFVAVTAPPNRHRLIMDAATGELGIMVSGTHTGSPILVKFFNRKGE